MAAPKEIIELVERFERNLEAYKAGQYNETQARREFIDPFFKALGWDIDNTAGYAEPYKDVIHEDQIRVAGAAKAPDYSFRIGGTRKFFLEAKKPSIYIKGDPSPAFQLRRYAWTESLPLSLLTDFEEFAIYDGRFKPVNGDDASLARIFYCTYKDYAEKWDWIASVFSRDAVLKGNFDKYAESVRSKRGTSTVDEDFLRTIERWRTDLAQNLALRNPALTQRELNFAVQRIIDRIIFLRICEDRAIEDYGRLRTLTEGERIYPRLCEHFEQADTRYNSGLFHFRKEKGRQEAPDELTLKLAIDDKLLRDILRPLYYPQCPYAFSHFPADILGQVYEQFLGKVIRLTEGHRAVIDEKPEVKKAGGVYYTPTYIVKYIVEQTVGKLLEGKTPKQAAALHILDPACGSGSFLIGAYQHLLDWHLTWYVQHDPAKHAKGAKPVLVQTTGGNWKLTIDERKRILLNNIYGVDIDAQAVETTKLSLLLKVLEGETHQTLEPVFKIFHERALPDLGNNIKCGNSLIGPDFYWEHQLPIFDAEERLRINVFDWLTEFPQIFRRRPSPGEMRETPASSPLDESMPGVPLHGGYSRKRIKEAKAALRPMEPEWEGGFDAVIGNPPYVRQESLAAFKVYFQQHYRAFDGVADLYTYFMEQGLHLLREGGLFSIIVSSSFLRATYAEPLRRALKDTAAVLRIVDFGGLAVFANAKDTYVCIPLLAKGAKPGPVEVGKVDSLQWVKTSTLSEHLAARWFRIPHLRLSPEAWSLKSDAEAAVFDKIAKVGTPLGEYVGGRIFYGIKTGLNEAFVIDTETRKQLISKDRRSAKLIHPLVGGEDIRRYYCEDTELWLIFTRRGVEIDDYPAIREHLNRWKEDLAPKRDKNSKRGRKPGRYQWYEIQDDVAYFEVFDGPKIIFPDICKGPRFCIDRTGTYLANTAYCLGTDDLYLLGVLNSRLFWFAISHISIPFGVRAGEFRYRLIYQYMEKVPVRVVDPKHRTDKLRHDRIIDLVQQTLDLHQSFRAARTPQEKTALERQIAATDAQIDRLVYELYGLTEEEIRIVEGEVAS